MKQLALIGPTASGKTSLSIALAQKLDAYILSLDSLSIYKEIDIASAKPSMKERAGIEHFGIDIILPNKSFGVTTYVELYQEAYSRAVSDKKSLIIVGGTSFYLKILIDGISNLPAIDNSAIAKTKESLRDLRNSHEMLMHLDPDYMCNIKPTDRYRIEKALNIYFQTSIIPSEYFAKNPPIGIIETDIPIYQISIDHTILRQKIALRTEQMLKNGLIDEVAYLERNYSRLPNCMKAIGIKEALGYLDGLYDKEALLEKITTNTARLAKRQMTFNNSQFESQIVGTAEEIEKLISFS